MSPSTIRRVVRGAALVSAVAVAYAWRPRSADHMGGVDETASLVICYGAMIAGMAAQYAFAMAERVSRGEPRGRFELLTFVMPMLVSPIVFIPLLTLTSELGAGGAFTRARLMAYLVAFQNGFFWKQLFEQRRQTAVLGGERNSERLAGV
jgi:hypothetical protein